MLEKPGDQDMRNKLMTNMKSITEEMGDEFPQLNKEMSALGTNAAGGPPVANTKTPTKGLAASAGTSSSAGPDSVEKRTNKEKFISKLPNLKEKLHKKDKHVVLSDHVVDDGGGGGAEAPPLESAQTSSAAGGSGGKVGGHRLSIEHTKDELVLLLPGKKRSKGNKGGGDGDQTRKDKKDGGGGSDDKERKSDKKEGKEASAQKPKQSKSEAVVAKIRNKAEKRDKKEAAHVDNDHCALIPPTSSGDQAVSAAADGHSQPNSIDPPAADTVEKVQELVKTKRLPQETITIHSPESGTTIF